MTDEELYTLFDDSDDPSDGMASYRALYQAGYRAGLEEATAELERLLDIPDECRDSTMDIYDLKRWLDAKLKEQP